MASSRASSPTMRWSISSRYYDYYQPEAYVPRTDTYIEKEFSINEQIDRMRHSATRALLERDDVIIVASVSCIYGIGSVETYTAMTFALKKGETHRPAATDRRPGRPAVQAHPGRFHPRHLSRARRRHRHLPGALRRPRLARQPVRRHGGEHRGVRSAHRPQAGRTRVHQDLRQLALRDAAADADPGHQVDQARAEVAARPAQRARAACWKRSGWSSAPPSTSR